MQEFEEAKDKVMLGSERRSMVMTDDEKRLTAYHEAGHAVVALHCPASDPIHKATIIPRGRALGMVMRLPERDQPLMVHTALVGRFNALNVAAALGILRTVGLSWEEAADGIAGVSGVPGRLERVPPPADAAVFVGEATVDDGAAEPNS